MPISLVFAREIARVIFEEVGSERGLKLLDRLVDRTIISKFPYGLKQSVVYIRNEFLLVLAGRG